MNDIKSDFIATLKYKTTAEGGRKTPAKSGYRPHIKFSFSEMRTSGQQVFIGKKLAYPGEVLDAEINIVGVEYFRSSLTEGMEFEFYEGPILIGSGKIVKIKNETLKRNADH